MRKIKDVKKKIAIEKPSESVRERQREREQQVQQLRSKQVTMVIYSYNICNLPICLMFTPGPQRQNILPTRLALENWMTLINLMEHIVNLY